MIERFNCPSCSQTMELDSEQFGQTVQCPACNAESFATRPKRYNAGTRPNTPTEIKQAYQPLEAEPGETIFFQNGHIAVTSARFMIETKTIAMRGVVSVDISESDELFKQRTGPKLLGMFAGFIFMGVGFCIGLNSDFDQWGWMLALIITGLLIIIFSIAISNEFKKAFTIILKTSSGDINAYRSFDRAHISQVVKALNQAITAK